MKKHRRSNSFDSFNVEKSKFNGEKHSESGSQSFKNSLNSFSPCSRSWGGEMSSSKEWERSWFVLTFLSKYISKSVLVKK